MPELIAFMLCVVFVIALIGIGIVIGKGKWRDNKTEVNQMKEALDGLINVCKICGEEYSKRKYIGFSWIKKNCCNKCIRWFNVSRRK